LSSMLLAQPAPGRLAAHHRGTSSCRRAVLVRAQQAGGKGADPAAAPPGAAPAEQQVAPYPTASEAASQEPQRQEYDEFAAVESDASYPADLAAFEQQMAAVQQAAPPPAGPRSGGSPLDLLQHPYARLAGIAAGVFLGGTFLVTLFRMRTDPERKRKKRMSKNKVGLAGEGVVPACPRLPLCRSVAVPSSVKQQALCARQGSRAHLSPGRGAPGRPCVPTGCPPNPPHPALLSAPHRWWWTPYPSTCPAGAAPWAPDPCRCSSCRRGSAAWRCSASTSGSCCASACLTRRRWPTWRRSRPAWA
jgi:hypothetical protein